MKQNNPNQSATNIDVKAGEDQFSLIDKFISYIRHDKETNPSSKYKDYTKSDLLDMRKGLCTGFCLTVNALRLGNYAKELVAWKKLLECIGTWDGKDFDRLNDNGSAYSTSVFSLEDKKLSTMIEYAIDKLHASQYKFKESIPQEIQNSDELNSFQTLTVNEPVYAVGRFNINEMHKLFINKDLYKNSMFFMKALVSDDDRTQHTIVFGYDDKNTQSWFLYDCNTNAIDYCLGGQNQEKASLPQVLAMLEKNGMEEFEITFYTYGEHGKRQQQMFNEAYHDIIEESFGQNQSITNIITPKNFVMFSFRNQNLISKLLESNYEEIQWLLAQPSTFKKSNGRSYHTNKEAIVNFDINPDLRNKIIAILVKTTKVVDEKSFKNGFKSTLIAYQNRHKFIELKKFLLGKFKKGDRYKQNPDDFIVSCIYDEKTYPVNTVDELKKLVRRMNSRKSVTILVEKQKIDGLFLTCGFFNNIKRNSNMSTNNEMSGDVITLVNRFITG